MFGGRANYTTLQPELFHGNSICVLIFTKSGTLEHVIGRQPWPGLCVIFLLSFPFPSLPL